MNQIIQGLIEATTTGTVITTVLFVCLTKPWAYHNFKAYKKALKETFLHD